LFHPPHRRGAAIRRASSFVRVFPERADLAQYAIIFWRGRANGRACVSRWLMRSANAPAARPLDQSLTAARRGVAEADFRIRSAEAQVARLNALVRRIRVRWERYADPETDRSPQD